MAKQIAEVGSVQFAVSAIVAAAKHDVQGESVGAQVSNAIRALYVSCNGDDVAFVATFGNGLNGGERKLGSIAEGVFAAVAKSKPEVQKRAKDVLKVRLSEARKLRKNGGMPKEDESIRQALARYAKPAADKAAKVKPETEAKVVFADDASMSDIAEALSVWVAKHGNAAAAGLAAQLADFMPVTPKRNTRKAS